MNKIHWLIIVMALSFIGQSASADELGGLVQRSKTLIDRLSVSILPGLKQPSRKWRGFSFAPHPARNDALQEADHTAREKRLSQNRRELFPVEQPANNLLRVRF